MGGFGSGRTGGLPTLEGSNALVVDINVVIGWVRQALRAKGLFFPLPPGTAVHTSPFALNWSRGKPFASVVLRLELGAATGTAWFTHDFERPSSTTPSQLYVVSLVTTSCRFGGHRWWWVCPQTGRRVCKLYLPDGASKFLSRGTGGHQLSYAVQREDKFARAHRRGHRIRRKLGSPDTGARSPIPPKPPRMRHATYRHLEMLLDDIEATLDAQLDAYEARLRARVGQL
jgi:hypothetical protein